MGGRLTAPAWLAEVVRLKPAATPWARMVRAPLAICLPLAVGIFTGHLDIGLLLALGALSSSIVERGGSYLGRVRRVGTVAILGGALGLTVGLLIHGRGWLIVAVVMVLAVVSAGMTVGGNVGAVTGLQLLLFATFATGPLGLLGPWWMVVLLFLAGAVWGLGLSVLGWLFFGRAPEERNVALAYRAIAAMLRAIGTEDFAVSRRNVRDALATAYDDVLSARARLSGEDRGHSRLVVLLNQAHLLADAAATLAHERNQPPPDVIDAVDAIAASLDGGSGPASAPRPAENDTPGMAALKEEIRAIVETLTDGRRAVQPRWVAQAVWQDRWRKMVDELRNGRFVRVYALRLTLCMGVAAVISEVAPLQRSYWVMLTVAVVLKPDLGAVVARALQRGIGTIVGAVIGAVLLAVIPYGPLLLIPLAVIAFLVPYAIIRNYGLFAVFLTPMVVLLIDLLSRGGWELAVARLVDTAVGCAVVLLLGYAPWPSSWYAHVGRQVAETVRAVGRYLDRVFDADRAESFELRRRAHRQLSDLHSVFQRALAEPAQVSRRMITWCPAVVALDHVVDAITATAVTAQMGAPAPTRPAVREMVEALDEFGTAPRADRVPHRRPLPGEPPAQRIADAIRGLQGALL